MGSLYVDLDDTLDKRFRAIVKTKGTTKGLIKHYASQAIQDWVEKEERQKK